MITVATFQSQSLKIIRDHMDYLDEGQVQNMRKTKKLKVSVQVKGPEKIIDV